MRGDEDYSPFAAEIRGRAAVTSPGAARPSFDLMPWSPLNPKSGVPGRPLTNSLLEFYVRPDGVQFLVHTETWGTQGTDRLDALNASAAENRAKSPDGRNPDGADHSTPWQMPCSFHQVAYPQRHLAHSIDDSNERTS